MHNKNDYSKHAERITKINIYLLIISLNNF